MTDNVTIELTNGAAVDRFFTGVADDLAHVGDPLLAALAPMLTDAAGAAPYATGQLAGAHYLERTGATVVQIGNRAPYARMVHEGTRYLKPRPWLTVTADADMPTVARRVAEGVQADIDRRASAT